MTHNDPNIYKLTLIATCSRPPNSYKINRIWISQISATSCLLHRYLWHLFEHQLPTTTASPLQLWQHKKKHCGVVVSDWKIGNIFVNWELGEKRQDETTKFLFGKVVFQFAVWDLKDDVTENLILQVPSRELHKLSQNHPILQGFSWISAASNLHMPMPRCAVQQRFMNFCQIGIPWCSQQRFQGGHVVVAYGHGQVAIFFCVGRPEIQLHQLNLPKLTENLMILHFSGTIFHKDPWSCFFPQNKKSLQKKEKRVKQTFNLHEDQQLCCDLPKMTDQHKEKQGYQ